jgi:hypothetical protein
MADNGTIELKGLDERIKQLGEASTKNPMMRKRINEVIRQALAQVRKTLQSDARSGLQMDSDPRHAYKAVRYAVYRRIFGGQVNILQSRRAGAMRLYEPPRTLKAGQRGGNRRQRSQRTTNMMSYNGVDRGFILRWLNNGMTKTNPRGIQFTENPNRKVDKWNKHPNTGSRGAIAPRNWFGNASLMEMKSVAGEMQTLIDKIIKEEFI